MDYNDRYWVVLCPHCKRLSIYENIRRGKTKTKKCPYCGKSFTIIRKLQPSWNIIKFTTNDFRLARAFMQKYLEKIK